MIAPAASTALNSQEFSAVFSFDELSYNGQMSKVLLIVAQNGFQTKEYHDPKRVLEAAGHTTLTASVEKGKASSNIGEEVDVDIALRDVQASNYDGVFIVGGPGAMRDLNNNETVRIMKEASASGRTWWGAICVSPRILAGAGLLSGKRATGWNADDKLGEIFSANGVTYERIPVVVDGRTITADGPASAEAFGRAIARSLEEQ